MNGDVQMEIMGWMVGGWEFGYEMKVWWMQGNLGFVNGIGF